MQRSKSARNDPAVWPPWSVFMFYKQMRNINSRAQGLFSQRNLPRVLSEVKEAEGLEDARRAPPRDFAAGGKGRARVSAAWNCHQWLQVAAAGKLCALTSYRGTRGEKRPTFRALEEPQTRRAPECSALSVGLDDEDRDRKRTTQKNP